MGHRGGTVHNPKSVEVACTVYVHFILNSVEAMKSRRYLGTNLSIFFYSVLD